MAAVSTFVANRPKPREAALFGVRWAIGHGLSLFLIGSLLFFFKRAAEKNQPELFASGALDRFVGLVLVGLGVWTLWQVASSRASKAHEHAHFHDGHLHSHGAGEPAHSHDASGSVDGAADHSDEEQGHSHGANGHSHLGHSHGGHDHTHMGGLASLGMGVLHGAAGTGAFIGQTVVSLSSSFAFVWVYTLLFSIGVLFSMGIYAGALGGLISSFERRGIQFLGAARLVTGVLTCAIGFGLVSGIELPGLFDHFVH